MDNDPNQISSTNQPEISDADARIAAEQYILNQQPAYGYETSPGFVYDESLFDRITSAIATNKLVLIPIIAVLVIFGSVFGVSMANKNNKTNNNTAEFRPGEDGFKNTVETVSINSGDEADSTNTGNNSENSGQSTDTSDTEEGSSTETSNGSNGSSTTGSGTTTPTISNESSGFDLCRNLPGIQRDVPWGYDRDINSNCNEPAQPSNPTPTPAPKDPTPTPSPTPITPDLCRNLRGTQTTVPAGQVRDSSGNCNVPVQRITKVLIVIEENTSYKQVTSTQWPYAYSIGHAYAYATRYSFLAGDSLPNYIAMAAGTTAGTSNDSKPGTLTQQTVFKQMISAGKTAKTYAQSMSGNCSNRGTGGYHFKHVPWLFFKNEKALCNQFNVPWATNFNRDVAAGKLPNFGMLIPDNNYNSHDGSTRAADGWFRDRMKTVFAGPDWKSGNLAVIFVFDEPKKDSKDNIYMAVIHPSTKGKGAVATPLNHYSITKLGAELSGKAPLGKGASANSIAKAFGLKL